MRLPYTTWVKLANAGFVTKDQVIKFITHREGITLRRKLRTIPNIGYEDSYLIGQWLYK